MKLSLQILLVLALNLSGSGAMAALALTGSVVITPDPAVLLRGQTATVTYTITNTGDEPFQPFSGTNYYDWGPTSTVYLLPNASTPPCSIQYTDLSPLPGNPPFVFATVLLLPQPLLPGDTRQCVSDLVVSTEAAGPFVQRFGLAGATATQSINLGQEFAFPWGDPGRSIPSMQPAGRIALILGALLLGVAMARQRSGKRPIKTSG